MDGCESPLDVLSRAATMVQHSSTGSTEDHVLKELPTTRWRRERRCQDKMGNLHKGAGIKGKDTSVGPLDMTLRPRPPPSYEESIAISNQRPSVITCHKPSKRTQNKNGKSTGMCDPMIEEHFRRSLGSDYRSVFSDDNVPLSGLSVDDHFAKALGDTWAKLQSDNPKERKTGTAEIVTTSGRSLTAPTPVLST